MGDPKKPKKQYNTPSHPWEKERIDHEKIIMKEYGLANKKEIWKFNTRLANFKAQAKKCATAETEQIQKEKVQLLTKLRRYGLLNEKGDIDDVLGLQVEDLLNRRLQSIVNKKNLTTTVKQARQFIVHGHVEVNSKKVTIPSYLVDVDEEDRISVKESLIQVKEK